MKTLLIDSERLTLNTFNLFLFSRENFNGITLSPETLKKVTHSHHQLLKSIEAKVPLYGVTTGFGDSCQRSLDAESAETLQKNLVDYLTCGSGPALPVEACRGALLARFKSLSRGYSGVRPELLERLQLLLERDWIPVIPAEGSLGASGDLVPLAYIAQCVQGQGLVYYKNTQLEISTLFEKENISPLKLHAKEGLAIVNGTSAMLGIAATNVQRISQILELSLIATTWTCLALDGRTEAFGELINSRGAQHSGQKFIAEEISALLNDESYTSRPLQDISIVDKNFLEPVQDRYSLRCSPQILGPVFDTLKLSKQWLEDELNTTSDNPLISPEGELANGGNFYGGYLAHSMDYLKICTAQIADMNDRQLILIMDEKSNRGLPPNLANWPGLATDKRFLHHGLKGLHQSASALTSEICALSMPNGVFSRSAECHNQDKVSLGMSAANQCSQMLEKSFTLITLQLICLAQALDLKKIKLQGRKSQSLYSQIRAVVPFVDCDRPLHKNILALSQVLKSNTSETFYDRI
ncbi:MAG: aromatic amino acid lyase [Bdellovibrionaceae bacterium]|nr:aromatic amino acid lyase [Pseudobdellovibrionaceae bacterium]